MKKNLAIDVEISNLDEAERYSEMIRSIWGNETFSLRLLKEALSDIVIGSYYRNILMTEFHLLPKSVLKYTPDSLEDAIRKLCRLNDEEYHFLTVTQIQCHLAKAEKLTALNDRVLQESSYFQEWEIEISSLLDIPSRAITALERQNIYTINDLSSFGATKKKLLEIRNLGETTVNIIIQAVKPYGLEIK